MGSVIQVVRKHAATFLRLCAQPTNIDLDDLISRLTVKSQDRSLDKKEQEDSVRGWFDTYLHEVAGE